MRVVRLKSMAPTQPLSSTMRRETEEGASPDCRPASENDPVSTAFANNESAPNLSIDIVLLARFVQYLQ